MEKKTDYTYLVTAFRWGRRENHSYTVGIYHKKHAAITNAEKEADLRGGKYSCLVEKVHKNQDVSLSKETFIKPVHLAKGRFLDEGTDLM